MRVLVRYLPRFGAHGAQEIDGHPLVVRWIGALALAMLLPLGDACGQPQFLGGTRTVFELPAVGQVVRASRAQGDVSGVLLRVQSDVLVIATKRDTVILDRASVRRLERSAGTRHRPLAGLAVGLLVGSAAGAIIGSATYREAECSPDTLMCLEFGRSFTVASAAVVGGASGSVLGAVIGGLARFPRWERVHKDVLHGASVSAAANIRGAQIGMHLMF